MGWRGKCGFAGFVIVLLAQHAALAQVRHGMGFVREPIEVYRSFTSVPRFRNWLPREVDLSARFPRAGSQGQQGSCTAWAVGYAVRSYW